MRLARLSAADWERIALVAVIIGAAIRAAWVLSLHPPLNYVHSDMGGYVDRAMKLASGGPLERYDAFYPPGTHWILAIPLAMWRFARHVLTVPAAAITAVLAAFWPINIIHSGYFLSETPALALLVGSLWLSAGAARDRSLRDFIRSGLVGGLAVANRPALAANLLVAALSSRRARLLATIGIGAGSAAVLALVIAYNSLAAGRLTFLSENSGLTMWLGQCGIRSVHLGDPSRGPYFEFVPPPALEKGTGRDVSIPDHAAWDQEYFYGLTLDCIRADGFAHLRTIARGIFDMTLTSTPWPEAEEQDLGPRIGFVNTMFSVALPFIIAGGIWVARERRRRGEPAGELVMLGHFACVLVTALLFFGDPRFRETYDVFALSAAAGWFAYVFAEEHARAGETAPASGG